MNRHVTVNSQSPGALLRVLPSICDYICDSVKSDGVVLVHCRTESWACTAACAYRKFSLGLEINDLIYFMRLVMSRGSSYEQAFCVIQNGRFFTILYYSRLADSP